ncbi:GAF domain-containing protein [Nonomuraea sp. NPDC050783]|uniref:GAF domain-containing protein n=1 Tax=Nonomuraea sp. NPDC050783 TaxID=3154634 RepID=UPI003467860D
MNQGLWGLRERSEHLIEQARAALRRTVQLQADTEFRWRRFRAMEENARREVERVRIMSDGGKGLQGEEPGGNALRRFLLPCLDQADRGTVLAAGLQAVLEITRADMGNVQLMDQAAGGLTIAAQHGFDRTFLDFFAVVDDDRSVCGQALALGRSVVVRDVERDPRMAGTSASRALLTAGVRMVHSAPMFGVHGEVMGMVSVHYRTARPLSGPERRLLLPLTGRLGRLLHTPHHPPRPH